MIRIGLTGSIGTGKSTTATLFAAEGVPVYDADQAVRELYGPGGAATAPVEAAFPGVVVGGAVDRSRLSAALLEDPSGFARLEAIVHPLVAAGRAVVLAAAAAAGADMVVLDIPLLFETGGDAGVDVVCVTSCPPELQRERVLARPGMTEEKLRAVLARQTPDAVKRARADVVIETGAGLEAARAQVRTLIERLRGGWRPERAGATAGDLDRAADAPQGPGP